MVKSPWLPEQKKQIQIYVACRSFLPLCISWEAFQFWALLLFLTAAESYTEVGPLMASWGLLDFPSQEAWLAGLLLPFQLSSVNRIL